MPGKLLFRSHLGGRFFCQASENMAKDKPKDFSLENPESVREFRVYEKSEMCTLSCQLREYPVRGLCGEQVIFSLDPLQLKTNDSSCLEENCTASTEYDEK